jgi:hypothetical protein
MVGRHLLQDPRDFDLIERLHEVEQRLVVQLGQHLACAHAPIVAKPTRGRGMQPTC